MSNDRPTFVCKDCGWSVYDALGEVRERCLECQWIAERPEDERPTLLYFLDRDRAGDNVRFLSDGAKR
jgi:hypothetical protein